MWLGERGMKAVGLVVHREVEKGICPCPHDYMMNGVTVLR